MEVRPGYKRTEVGVIPEDWDVCNLVQVSSKITDGDHLTPKRERKGFYLLSARNVRDGRIDLTDVDYVGSDEYKRMRQRCAPEVGDLLISCSGHGLGRVSIVPEGLECVLVRSAALVKLNFKKVNSLFVQYWLQSNYAQNQISISKSLAAQPNFFIGDIKRLHCLIPATVTEQRAIAVALSDVDVLLDGLERLIAKKRDLKQATMQQLITGQTRLPGFNSEWMPATINSLCEYAEGVSTSGSDLSYIEIGDIDVFSKTYNLSGKEKPAVRGAIRVPSGTLLISTVRPTRGAIAVTKYEIFVSSAFCRLRPFNGFLFHLVCQDRFLAYLGENSIGGTYPTCRDETILSYKSLVPSDPVEQAAIATVLSDMDAEISALVARRDKTGALKQAMMQELLTGKTRLV